MRNAKPGSASSATAGRGAGICGLASFSLIMLAAFVLARPLWNAPDTQTAPAALASYIAHARGREATSLLLYALGIGLFLCFTAGLWRWLGAIEPGRAPTSAIFAFGAIALSVLIFAAFAVAEVMLYRPLPPVAAETLRDLTFALLALSGVPTAVCMGAYASLVLRHGVLARWTGWLALVGVLAHLLIAMSFLDHTGLLSLEGPLIVLAPGTFFTWIFAASLALLEATHRHGSVAPLVVS
jgi:hypothetical protein